MTGVQTCALPISPWRKQPGTEGPPVNICRTRQNTCLNRALRPFFPGFSGLLARMPTGSANVYHHISGQRSPFPIPYGACTGQRNGTEPVLYSGTRTLGGGGSLTSAGPAVRLTLRCVGMRRGTILAISIVSIKHTYDERQAP